MLLASLKALRLYGHTWPRQKVKIADSCVIIFSLLLKYFAGDWWSCFSTGQGNLSHWPLLLLSSLINFCQRPRWRWEPYSHCSVPSNQLPGLPPTLTVSSPYPTYELDWLQSALKFSADIVKARPTLNLPPSLLERNLYMLAPHLAMLYTRYANLRSAFIDLFIAIVSAPNPEQPSLLAHLGIHAHMFISNLTGSLENGLESEGVHPENCHLLFKHY